MGASNDSSPPLRRKVTLLLYWSLTVFLFAIVIASMLGEKVAYNDGAGWDGLFYRNVASGFSHQIFTHQYDGYHLQRVLPFAIVNLVFSAFHLPKLNDTLMIGVQVLNLLALALGVFYYFKIANRLKFSFAITIIGFSILFLNFPILKQMGYYPFLTDTYALSLGIVQFSLFIRKQRLWLVLVSIIGAFVWPLLFTCGLILAFLPDSPIVEKSRRPKFDRAILISLKVAAVIIVPLLFVGLYFIRPDLIMHSYSGAHFSSLLLLVVSLIAVLLYLFVLVRPIRLSISGTAGGFFRELKLWSVVGFLAIYIAVSVVVRILSDGTSPFPLSTMLIGRILVPPTVDPLVFLVSHFMYFGPGLILLLLLWSPMVSAYFRYGVSFCLVISMGLMMSLNSESRHLLSFVPFLMFPLLQYLSDETVLRAKTKFAVFVCLGSLLISRFWYTINIPGIHTAFADGYEKGIGSYQDYPAQSYFMALGPWMSHDMYYVFASLFLICLIVVALYAKRTKVFAPMDENRESTVKQK